MAIAKGVVSKEAPIFKNYIGICTMLVAGVNPNKSKHEELFNTTLEQEPSYLTIMKDRDGNDVDNLRISIILKPIDGSNGVDVPLIPMSIFLQNKANFNRDKSKVQVIDKYGRTAWVSVVDAKNHVVPNDKNGNPFSLDKDYRPAYVGEEYLTKFVKTFLGIPDVEVYDKNTNSRVPNTEVDPQNCECRLDKIANYFKGDLSELTETLESMPTNKIKVALGVRTDPMTGMIYQAVYNREFAKSEARTYKGIERAIQADNEYLIQSGKAINTEYSTMLVHEYTVTPTSFTQPTPTEAPVEVSAELPLDIPTSPLDPGFPF